jgi:hypothetical protein
MLSFSHRTIIKWIYIWCVAYLGDDCGSRARGDNVNRGVRFKGDDEQQDSEERRGAEGAATGLADPAARLHLPSRRYQPGVTSH